MELAAAREAAEVAAAAELATAAEVAGELPVGKHALSELAEECDATASSEPSPTRLLPTGLIKSVPQPAGNVDSLGAEAAGAVNGGPGSCAMLAASPLVTMPASGDSPSSGALQEGEESHPAAPSQPVLATSAVVETPQPALASSDPLGPLGALGLDDTE
jgi:hypothetical protein